MLAGRKPAPTAEGARRATGSAARNRCIRRPTPLCQRATRRAALSAAAMMQAVKGFADKVKDKAAEIRAEIAAELADAAATPAGGAATNSLVGQLAAENSEVARAAGARQLGMHLCGHDIEGVSIAGQETCIMLPRLKIAFDLGRCPQRSVPHNTVLITHGHLDHIGGLPCHASSRALLGMEPAKYVVHPSYVERLDKWCQMAAELEGGGETMRYNLTPLEAGEELVLPTGHIVRPFATTHTLPSQGYLLYSYRKKLKAELVGRSGEEIKALREAGEEVTDTYQIPEVAFTGDTSGALFEDPSAPADLYRAKLLIVELTFVDESVSWDQARERGHMHIADLVAHAHKFHNEAILLVHFSPRYSRAQILASLEANMPPSLRAKCVPFLNGFV